MRKDREERKGEKKTGRKEIPEEVAKEMCLLTRDGERVFSKDQFLTEQQISSYFSTLVLKRRLKVEPTEEDITAADDETVRKSIKKNIDRYN